MDTPHPPESFNVGREPLFQAAKSPYLVPDDGSFRVARAATSPPAGVRSEKKNRAHLAEMTERLGSLQHTLYADDRFAVLLIFQAMDAGGKDSTIRHVMSGVNPAGCQVFSFKRPSDEELDHDFLWRSSVRLPERGRIGIFNRSYYEEVLVVRVHPEILRSQRLPLEPDLDAIWKSRMRSIRDHERHLADNGTLILKFWLNVSADEQRRRFLSRIDEPEKNWKFSAADLDERDLWGDYMAAYERALRKTSRRWAPWYAIPADDKPFMRATVAEIIVRNLEQLPIRFPEISETTRQTFEEMRRRLG